MTEDLSAAVAFTTACRSAGVKAQLYHRGAAERETCSCSPEVMSFKDTTPFFTSSSPRTGTNTQVLTALESYQGRSEVFDQGLEELNTVVKYLSAFGSPGSGTVSGPER